MKDETQILIPKWFTYAFIILYTTGVYYLTSSCLTRNLAKNMTAFIMCIFLLLKWATDIRACTVSYAECKIRGVKKEQGFVNNFMEGVINLNQHGMYRGIQLIVTLIAIINFIHAREEYVRISSLYGNPGFFTIIYNITHNIPPTSSKRNKSGEVTVQNLSDN